MKLYLVRHGLANSADTDPEKGLSDRGQAEITHLAEAIRHLDIRVKDIYHSGKARAEQTAHILAGAVKSQRGVNKTSGLEPTDPVEGVALELLAAGEDIMLVGHLPFMAKLESYLLTGDDDRGALEFKTGAMACLELMGGRCSLKWFINPEIVAADPPGQFRSYH